MPLVTVAQVKGAYLPQNLSSSTNDDTMLTDFVNRASRLIAKICGYPPPSPGAPASMEARTYVLDLTGDGSRDLDLKVYPVCSVSAAAYDLDRDFDGGETSFTSSNYGIVDGRKLRMKSDSTQSWQPTPESNRITFVAGYGGSSTVNGSHNASVTTITVASTAQFATNRSGGGRVYVGSEVITFTAKTATTLTGCTRGAEGTTAASISDGATISQPIPDDLVDAAGWLVKWMIEGRRTAAKANDPGILKEIPEHILSKLGGFMLPMATS